MSDIHIRPAVLDDKEAVMGIHDNVYGGRDYLMSFYEHFINEDNSFPYVALIDDEIVGFCTAFLVDDMKTLVSRAARVSPRHGGKGVYKLLMDFVKARARDMGVKHYRFTTNSGNKIVQKPSFRNQNRHILTKDGFPYYVNGLDWKPKGSDVVAASGPKVPSTSDLENYISSDRYGDYLFPAGVLIVDWVPYKLCRSNLDIARKYHNTLVLSDVSVNDAGEPVGNLSISTISECSPRRFLCNLDVYGCDLITFRQHLVRQLEFTASRAKGPTSLVIFMFSDVDVDPSAIRRTCEEVGLEESSWIDPYDASINYCQLILFESDI